MRMLFSLEGHQKLILRTVDTDVVVLAIANMQKLNVSELWIAFGVGKNFRYIRAHSIAMAMGPEKASALPFFHAVTGCDTVSAFAGRGKKKTAWEVWSVFPEITCLFAALSRYPVIIEDAAYEKIERFVVLLYSRTLEATLINKSR